MRRVGRPSRAMAAAKLMAVVVLPTPPFWLTTAMTLDGAAADAVAADWGLLMGWIVIIGVRRRVSVGEDDGNAGVLCRSGESCGELVERLFSLGVWGV